MSAAAFGRLCVETLSAAQRGLGLAAAAFGRLCVETASIRDCPLMVQVAAAFGRLCVETALP